METVLTWFEVSQLATDNLCIVTAPLRVSDSAPCPRQVDFHSTFPLVGTSYQTNISILVLAICMSIIILCTCRAVASTLHTCIYRTCIYMHARSICKMLSYIIISLRIVGAMKRSNVTCNTPITVLLNLIM